jgi:hypothetical protein
MKNNNVTKKSIDKIYLPITIKNIINIIFFYIDDISISIFIILGFCSLEQKPNIIKIEIFK